MNSLWLRGLAMAGLIVAVTIPTAYRAYHGRETFWSPYYEVEYEGAPEFGIYVNNIAHQYIILSMTPWGSSYPLIHLLQKAAGGAPFQDVLIIGAGSGNDIDYALPYGVGRINAVDILDPVIQSIGIKYNPDLPYSDPRVVRRYFLTMEDICAPLTANTISSSMRWSIC